MISVQNKLNKVYMAEYKINSNKKYTNKYIERQAELEQQNIPITL
jgi:hypothetical protein